jgi:hypothetical protein
MGGFAMSLEHARQQICTLLPDNEGKAGTLMI